MTRTSPRGAAGCELALYDRVEKLITDERNKNMQKLSVRFYVIDPEGQISWNEDNDASEYFKSRSAALQRAREMAETEPGKTIYIAEAVEAVICSVGKPERLGIR